ncbi:MAG TPA: F0F1 ATP synthase subunit delta [Acidimicrobiales bacterium]|nr:F0F1 ATP synthase subunit delta [Acidimicrobiales bacterium]
MLAKLEGFATAQLGRLSGDDLAVVVADLRALVDTVRDQSAFDTALTDTSIAPLARGAVVRDVLTGKVSPTTVRLAAYAATESPAPEVPRSFEELAHVARTLAETGALDLPGLGLLESRHRVAGYTDAVLEDVATERFARVETELFEWARTIEASPELRRVLLDRDAPLGSRLGLTDALVGARGDAVTLDLARFVVIGGRPRDVIGTLDFLVDYVAAVRAWRVARVRSARPLDEASREALRASLTALTGLPVELQVDVEPDLLGGVLVQVGDLRLDATTRGRLGVLRDAVAAPRGLVSALAGPTDND